MNLFWKKMGFLVARRLWWFVPIWAFTIANLHPFAVAQSQEDESVSPVLSGQELPDPQSMFQAGMKMFEDGFFHQESTLLTNPPIDLRGQTKNRWQPVHLDPQKNVIEPFNRRGDDTYLALIDNFKDCKS